MSTDNNPIQNSYDAPFSFAIWLNDWVKKVTAVVKAKYKLIFMLSILGAALGLAYSQLKSTRYKSDITFLVEERNKIG